MAPKAGMRWRQYVSMETTGRKGRERERERWHPALWQEVKDSTCRLEPGRRQCINAAQGKKKKGVGVWEVGRGESPELKK